MTKRLTHNECRDVISEATHIIGASAFWRHRESRTVYVKVGITLRESDLVPLVRHYEHGTVGVEFARPLSEFLERFERTDPPHILAALHGD